MVTPTDFANHNPNCNYCQHCMRPDGSMVSFAEEKQQLTAFIIRTQGFAFTVAENMALANMQQQPAWQKYFKEI